METCYVFAVRVLVVLGSQLLREKWRIEKTMVDIINGYGESRFIQVVCDADMNDIATIRQSVTLNTMILYEESIHNFLVGCLPMP